MKYEHLTFQALLTSWQADDINFFLYREYVR